MALAHSPCGRLQVNYIHRCQYYHRTVTYDPVNVRAQLYTYVSVHVWFLFCIIVGMKNLIIVKRCSNKESTAVLNLAENELLKWI